MIAILVLFSGAARWPTMRLKDELTKTYAWIEERVWASAAAHKAAASSL
jgi:hypothetical protein